LFLYNIGSDLIVIYLEFWIETNKDLGGTEKKERIFKRFKKWQKFSRAFFFRKLSMEKYNTQFNLQGFIIFSNFKINSMLL